MLLAEDSGYTVEAIEEAVLTGALLTRADVVDLGSDCCETDSAPYPRRLEAMLDPGFLLTMTLCAFGFGFGGGDDNRASSSRSIGKVLSVAVMDPCPE